jgi:D-threo-aldose 1-dehydrogenase
MAHKLTDRRQAGKTTLQLPPFGFGTAHLGGMYSRPSGEVARATLQAAWDGGVRFYDTAPYYGLGLSEHRTGNFLMDQPRDQFILTTKIGRYFKRPADPTTFDRGGWGGGLNMEIVWDYSYDGVMRSYEQSLLRLGLDTIDALFIHDPEPAGHGEHHAARMKDMATTGIKALEELKSSGQIKAIGMGMNAADSLVNIAPLVPLDFCIVAMPYTLLDQGSLNTGMKRCLDEGISVVIGAPYASGILATGPIEGARYAYGFADEATKEKTRRIMAVAARHGVSLQAAALQFPLAHPTVVSVIPGGAKPEEVTSNLRYLTEVIPAAFWAELKAQGLIVADAPVPTT